MMFCMKINIKVFYKLTVLFLLVIARYAQSTQNGKLVSFHCLKKEERNENVFLHTDKHQTYLQVDPISSGGHMEAYPSYPK